MRVCMRESMYARYPRSLLQMLHERRRVRCQRATVLVKPTYRTHRQAGALNGKRSNTRLLLLLALLFSSASSSSSQSSRTQPRAGSPCSSVRRIIVQGHDNGATITRSSARVRPVLRRPQHHTRVSESARHCPSTRRGTGSWLSARTPTWSPAGSRCHCPRRWTRAHP